MIFKLVSLGLLAVVAAWTNCADASDDSDLTVSTKTGTYVGAYNDSYPDVRQFLYIPYAQPPINALRFAPPQKVPESSAVIHSTTFGPMCPQFYTKVPGPYTTNVTGARIPSYGQGLLDGVTPQTTNEDCLSLAVWTPKGAKPGDNLPVLVWIYGGGFTRGGIDVPSQTPTPFVHNTQRHIVVSINYRMNIFGFPNAAGLGDKNLNVGFLDQRLGIEWVRDNIYNFGGDASRIVIYGQSAGAGSVDAYLYAWYKDPIIAGSISASGVVTISKTPGLINPNYATTSNFSFVAKAMGCGYCDSALELECMRRTPFERIENFIGQYQDNSTLVNKTQPPITFTPIIDNMTYFSNPGERIADGRYISAPKIIGSCSNEGGGLAAYPVPYTNAGPNNASVSSINLATVCSSYDVDVARYNAGLTTYRYQYAGNFENLSGGVPWLGAYHYADNYMVFGTYNLPPGPVPQLEADTSKVMEEMFLAFITDPSSLPGKGWPTMNPLDGHGGQIARFGTDGKALQLVEGDEIEGVCHGVPGATYNNFP